MLVISAPNWKFADNWAHDQHLRLTEWVYVSNDGKNIQKLAGYRGFTLISLGWPTPAFLSDIRSKGAIVLSGWGRI